MQYNTELAEMADTADYAAMNYGELLKTKLAFNMAVGLQINPLLEEKRLEEMAKITHIYITTMSAYNATRSEILGCLEAEGMKEEPPVVVTDNSMAHDCAVGDTILAIPEHVGSDKMASDRFVPWDETLALLSQCNEDVLDKLMSTPPKMKSPDSASTRPDEIDLWEHWASLAGEDILDIEADQDVDDQTQEAVHDESRNEQTHNDTILLSPEHFENIEDDAQGPLATESADVEERPVEEELEIKEAASMEANNETLVEEAMSIMRALPVPKDIDPNEPYYMECDFSYEGELGHSDPSGRNMRRSDLEEFRSASEVYYRIFMKKNIIESTEDCLAYNDSLNTYTVRLYHFPKDTGNAVDTPTQDVALTADETKELKKKKAYLRKAIKLAKEYTYSDETDVHTPFYDRYKFSPGLGKNLDLKSDRVRVYEDAANLTELMPAFESYARLFQDGFTVMVQDNCVAAMKYHDIYVVQFNIPVQEKKKRVPKKSAPAAMKEAVAEDSDAITSTSATQTVDDLVLKAVDMTKNLPLTNGTEANSAYYLQSSFSVTNEGALIYSGKSFSRNVSLDDLDRCRRKHEKLAKTMKASKTVSSDGYIAFVSNDGKTITVYYYSTKAANACNC